MKARYLLLLLVPLLLSFAQPSLAASDSQQKQDDIGMQRDLSAMQQFNAVHQDEAGILKVELKKKHEILFFMGIGLLVGLLLTVTFGLGMVLDGKPWFLWHMLSAGFSVTLALAHAVTAIIWFYPF
jgi:hypothetical protein